MFFLLSLFVCSWSNSPFIYVLLFLLYVQVVVFCSSPFCCLIGACTPACPHARAPAHPLARAPARPRILCALRTPRVHAPALPARSARPARPARLGACAPARLSLRACAPACVRPHTGRAVIICISADRPRTVPWNTNKHRCVLADRSKTTVCVNGPLLIHSSHETSRCPSDFWTNSRRFLFRASTARGCNLRLRPRVS